jgi:hypothetical protein
MVGGRAARATPTVTQPRFYAILTTDKGQAIMTQGQGLSGTFRLKEMSGRHKAVEHKSCAVTGGPCPWGPLGPWGGHGPGTCRAHPGTGEATPIPSSRVSEAPARGANHLCHTVTIILHKIIIKNPNFSASNPASGLLAFFSSVSACGDQRLISRRGAPRARNQALINPPGPEGAGRGLRGRGRGGSGTGWLVTPGSSVRGLDLGPVAGVWGRGQGGAKTMSGDWRSRAGSGPGQGSWIWDPRPGPGYEWGQGPGLTRARRPCGTGAGAPGPRC